MAGNAVQCPGLDAPTGALVVRDRGMATEANLLWLRQRGYRYLVVSRERGRRMPEGEVRPICHSPVREAKEQGIVERFCQRLEAGLENSPKGSEARAERSSSAVIHERIGKLAARCSGSGAAFGGEGKDR